jgi:hypothetical protein
VSIEFGTNAKLQQTVLMRARPHHPDALLPGSGQVRNDHRCGG